MLFHPFFFLFFLNFSSLDVPIRSDVECFDSVWTAVSGNLLIYSHNKPNHPTDVYTVTHFPFSVRRRRRQKEDCNTSIHHQLTLHPSAHAGHILLNAQNSVQNDCHSRSCGCSLGPSSTCRRTIIINSSQNGISNPISYIHSISSINSSSAIGQSS